MFRIDTPRETFALQWSPMCDPKIFTYNCVCIDLKLHLDRFRSSDLFLVTFLELMKGGLKREIFGGNLVTVSRSARGKNGCLVSFIIGHVIHYKGVKLIAKCENERKWVYWQKMQRDNKLKWLLHKSSASQPHCLSLLFSWIVGLQHGCQSNKTGFIQLLCAPKGLRHCLSLDLTSCSRIKERSQSSPWCQQMCYSTVCHWSLNTKKLPRSPNSSHHPLSFAM